MENENDFSQEEVSNDSYEYEEVAEVTEEDTTDWKAKALELEGRVKRYQKKLKKQSESNAQQDKTVSKTDTTQTKQSNELGYGEKAYLIANGVKGADEIALVKEYMDSGKSLEAVIDSKHFQNDLKDLRESRVVREATPTNTKRSSTPTRDTVDYWLAKGELPPPEQVQLRRDVLNAKIKKASEGSKFSSNPVISN